MTTPGRRVHPKDDVEVVHMTPGDYGICPVAGHWLGRTPNGHLCNLANHKVTEHDDGTITVAPSILVYAGNPNSWHGYLEKGVWREC